MLLPVPERTKWLRLSNFLLPVMLIAGVTACGSDDTSFSNDDPAVEYAVGGMVSGLEASGLVLKNNGEDQLEVDEDGEFNFETTLADGTDYEVTVAATPSGHACEVENGSGTIDGADVDDVIVECDSADPPGGMAEFMVDVDEQASTTEVEETQTVVVVAEVENRSDFSAEQTLTLAIDGEQKDAQKVELDAGDTEAVPFEWTTEVGDAGEYLAIVSSDYDSGTTGVVVDEVEDEDSAHFQVTIDTDATTLNVVEEDTVFISADIENTGQKSATQDIEFGIDGEIKDSTSLTVDGGESTSVEFSWKTEVGDAGEYTASVESEDHLDEVEVSVDVLDVDAPPYFEITIEEGDSTLEADAGDSIIIDTTITNTGDEEDTQDIQLLIGGDLKDSHTDVHLASGQDTNVQLQWETSPGDEGYHSAEVQSEDHAQSVTVTVGEPDDADATLTGNVRDASTGDNLQGVDVLLFESGADSPVDTATTGSSGNYSFSGVELGDYELRLKAPGLEPNYDIDEAGGGDVLSITIDAGGLVEQDLSLEWLRQTDLIIDGGVLEFENDDGEAFVVPFPGCDQSSDGSWEPEDVDIDDDSIDITFEPEDECFHIRNVDIDIATGVFDIDADDDVVFPNIIVYMDADEFGDEVEAIEIELRWLIDDAGGQVDFRNGFMEVDLDLRILVGGTAYSWLNIHFGFRNGDHDCQLTGAWGGDIDNPQQDTADEQIGHYLHDPIELRLTTEESGAQGAQGVPYDPDTGLVIAIDHTVSIDRISEGPIGNNDPGGAGCGDLNFMDFQVDFAETFNDLIGLPADDGEVLLDFNLWVD